MMRPVVVGRPGGAIGPQEARSGTLLATEAEPAVEQARHELLETHRLLVQPAAQLLHYPVDHAAGNQHLADRGVRRSSRMVREQVADRVNVSWQAYWA
jgi:hypothetical protein